MSDPDKRQADVEAIENAYNEAEAALSKVGKLLRTTEAGKFIWASDHKTAVSGLRILVKKLRADVPGYGRK